MGFFNHTQLLSLITFLVFICSCSGFRPYRATIGISTNSTKYSVVKSDGRIDRKLCVESVNEGVTDATSCSGEGFKEDKGLGYIDPWIEFYPRYFSKSSSFGWSSFLAFNRSTAVLLDYPFTDEKAEIEIDRVSFNPILFYNLGDAYIKKGKGISFRIGLGAALSYISKFKVRRVSTDESFNVETKLKPGWASFVEFTWNWFIFRVENSQISYEGKKFQGVESDILKIENNKASLYYAYYF